VWVAVIALALTVAVFLTAPRRDRAIFVALIAVWTATWTAIAWGNATALVVLGIAIWTIGLRRESTVLLTTGILLASIKIVPAIPLALYLLRSRRVAPVAWAAGAIEVTTFVVAGLDRTNVVADFIRAFDNIRQTTDVNIAPSALIKAVAPSADAVLPLRVGAVVAIAALSALRPSIAIVGWMELIVLALPLNVYSFWLLHPVIVGLAWMSEDETRTAAGHRSLYGRWHPSESRPAGTAE
jgi:hypothetical protein